MMDNNHNNLGNKPQGDSYTELEKIIRSSAYSKNKPSDAFRARLLSELKTKAFNEASMKKSTPVEAAKPVKASEGKTFTWPIEMFTSFKFIPVTMGSLAVVVLIAVLAVSFALPNKPGTDTTVSPIVINTDDTPTADLAFALKPLDENATGINPATEFELTSATDTSAEAVQNALTFEPATTFTVAAINAKNYTVKPDQPLPADSIVKVTLSVASKAEDGTTTPKNFTWAYQVQEKFQVVSTLPRHKADYVPINTGIEITFSHENFKNTEANFDIEPEVKGRFEIRRTTVAFVPEQPLKNSTYYQVTIGKDVKLRATGETLEQDYMFSFVTDSKTLETTSYATLHQIGQKTMEISPNEIARVRVSGYSLEQASEGNLKIYQFKNQTDYQAALTEFSSIPAWAYNAKNIWQTDTSQLQLHSETRVKFEQQNYWEFFINFPGKLDAGFYVVELNTEGGIPVQSLLHVSELANYTSVSETETLVWLHETTTDKPVANAKVSLNGTTELGSTDDNGLMRIETPKDLLPDASEMTGFFKVEAGDETLYTPLLGYDAYGSIISDQRRVQPYWNYLYNDQPIYHTNDTINFWGVVKHRDSEEIPKKITVALVRYQDFWSEQKAIISKQELTPDELGSFQGQLTISNVAPDYSYSLEMQIGDTEIARKSLIIQSYVKPLYDLDIDPKNYYIIRDEQLTHTTSAHFFDGTPVTNLKLNVSDGGSLTTNSEGKAGFSKTYRNETGQFQYEYLSITPEKAEEAEMTTETYVIVLPGSKITKIQGESDGNRAIISGTAHRFDIETLNSGNHEPNGLGENAYGETLPNEKVKLEIKRSWYTKKQTGTAYDAIAKTTSPIYDYEHHEENVRSEEVTTNAQGKFSLEFDMIEDSSYETVATVTDEQGRFANTSAYTYAQNYESLDAFGESMYLIFPENKEGRYLEKSIGDEFHVQMLRKGKRLADSEQADFLYIQAREGIRDAALSTSPEYRFNFAEEHVPNVLVQGVWYNGDTYIATSIESPEGFFGRVGFSDSVTVGLKETDRQLDIAVKSDKENYGPGDKVRLDFIVTTNDGKGTAAALNVNLIDEAIYAVLGSDNRFDVNFLDDLYKDVRSGIYTRYTSHAYAINPGGAEGGGGSNDPRANFQDKALFQSLTTDANGKASTEFTLPDNLTSWRVTTHALNEDYFAGSHTDAVVVKLPFFVDAVVSDTYMLSDDPKIKVRTFGEELTTQAGVKITVSSKTLGMEPVNVSTNGLSSVDIDLPPLTVGTHTLVIGGKSGDYEDFIEQKFTVIPSQLVLPQTTLENVNAGWRPQVDSEQGFDVVLSDANIGKYFNAITNLRYSFGARLDNQATRVIATELLNQYFEGSEQPETIEFVMYQPTNAKTGSGGLSILPYSDEDLELTAGLAASRLADELDRWKLVKYFETILFDEKQTTLRHAQSLYGLAALEEPVLPYINTMLESDQITDVDRLYLALAKAELGDQNGARAIYQPLVEKYGRRDDELMHLELGKDEEMERHAILGARVAALLNDEQADQFFNYATSKTQKVILLDLEKINFIEDRVVNLPKSPVKITYRHLGEEKTVELKNGETHLVTLTPATTADFEVTGVEGNVLATVQSLRAGNLEDFGKDERLSIERQYQKETFGENEIIKVTIRTNIDGSAPEGVYEITELVPAGMRIVSQPFAYVNSAFIDSQNLGWPYRVDGQRISFLVFRNDGQDTLEYFVRPVTKGTYTAEAPLLRSSSAPSVRTFGNETKVTIE